MSDAHDDAGDALARRLLELGTQIEYPATPPLATTIRQHLPIRAGARSRPRSPGPGRSLRGLTVLAAAFVALLAGILAASPPARATVAHWLAVPGIELHVGLPSHVPLGHALHLGKAVTLAEAESEVPFHILVPSARNLAAPDAVYVAHSSAGDEVSLVYGSRPGLPQATTTHVALLITELPARLDTQFFAKFLAGKQPRRLTLGPEHGYWVPAVWVPGGHLVVLYQYEDQRRGGQLFVRQGRLAANTLLWQYGNVTLRLESSLAPASATHIARSMR